jgi:RNA-binding protein
MPQELLKLKGFQRRYLRALAHPLKPVILVGQRGVSDELLESLNQALDQHELIKIKFIDNKSKPDKTRITQILQSASQAHWVGTIGHTVVFYRQSSDQEKQHIVLPRQASDESL